MVWEGKTTGSRSKNGMQKRCSKKALKNEKNVNEGLAVVAGGAGKDPRGEVGER